MEIQNSDATGARRADSIATDLTAGAAKQVDKALGATIRATDSAAQSVHAGLETMQDQIPGALAQAGVTADQLIDRGVQRVRAASSAVRETSAQAQERATVYIREKPMNAVLIAAGVGAMVALLLSGRSRH